MSGKNDWQEIIKGLGSINYLNDLPTIEPLDTDIPELELSVNPTYELIEKQKEANEFLQQIVENTSVLKELVEINRNTQLSAEKLTELMMEINLVAQAKSKEEADNLFKKAINKINVSGETASNIASLVNLLSAIYNAVKPYLN